MFPSQFFFLLLLISLLLVEFNLTSRKKNWEIFREKKVCIASSKLTLPINNVKWLELCVLKVFDATVSCCFLHAYSFFLKGRSSPQRTNIDTFLLYCIFPVILILLISSRKKKEEIKVHEIRYVHYMFFIYIRMIHYFTSTII